MFWIIYCQSFCSSKSIYIYLFIVLMSLGLKKLHIDAYIKISDYGTPLIYGKIPVLAIWKLLQNVWTLVVLLIENVIRYFRTVNILKPEVSDLSSFSLWRKFYKAVIFLNINWCAICVYVKRYYGFLVQKNYCIVKNANIFVTFCNW